MNEAELSNYVIRRLGQHVSRNDLLFELCQGTGMSWDQATAFVREVEEQRAPQIARRQSLVFVVLGVGTLLGGIALTLTSASYFGGVVNHLLDPLNLYRDYYALARLITGLAMILGSLYGLWKVYLSVLPR